MAARDPKTYSTQLLVPQALSGSEPSAARDGSLSYDPVLGVLRLKAVGFWTDVGTGSGTITAVVAGTGLSGGGASGSVTLNVVYGTSAGTSVEGNDSRVVNAVPNTRTVSAGTGLTGGGDLSTNRTLAADFGTGAGKVTQGNDSRLSDSRTPTGSAGGDLAGTFPNPTVTQARGLRETAGPTTLAMSAVAASTLLSRDGSSQIVGAKYGDFTHIASPGTTDKIALDNGALGYCTVSELASVLQTRTGNPYIDPPTSSNALDDEFIGGSNDLATRGWTVKEDAFGATLTRSGDVNPWDATGPAAGHYWSTIVGSFILVQFPITVTSFFIFKAITLSAGDTFFARVGTGNVLSLAPGSAGQNFAEVGIYGDNAGRPDFNNRAWTVVHAGSGGSPFVGMGRATAAAYSTLDYAINGAAVGDIRGVRYGSGTTYSPFIANSANGDTLTFPFTGGPSAGTFAWFSITYTPALFAGQVPFILSIDFARRVTSGAWIAQN